MNHLAKLLLPLFRKYIIEQMTKEENKSFVISKLNKHVDLPNMSEEEEAEVIKSIYNAIADITKAYLGKNG